MLGMITAGGTFWLLSNSTNVEPPPTRKVVVVQQPIPQRSQIAPDAITLKDLPVDALPPTGTSESMDKVIGKLALVPMYPGQIVLDQMVISKEDADKNRSNASFLVPEGKVAVAFPLSDLSGVAGALQTGDVVDILLTLNPNQLTATARPGTTTAAPVGTEGLPVTQLMLQNVPILQVGAWQVQDKNSAPSAWITFVLNRQDALALKSAREQGVIEFVLRPATKDKDVPFTTEAVTLQYLNRRFNFNLLPVTNR
ncbi:MAG: Flp pilus assembly protein CpaB [Chloroflexi bacterium]|nr:Flp pilus assembly protein CpaB [Chloroflexota bacterium]